MFQFVHIAACAGTRHHCEEPGSILFALSLQVGETLVRPLLPASSRRGAQFLHYLDVTLFWIISSMPRSLLYKVARNWAQHSTCILSGADRRTGSPLDLLAVLCLMQPRMQFAALASRARY